MIDDTIRSHASFNGLYKIKQTRLINADKWRNE